MALLGICKNNKWNGKLTKFFTGTRAYHTIWKTDNFIYDMNLLRRRRDKNKYNGKEVIYYDFPFVDEDYLEMKLTTDYSHYGFIDYVLFAVRPIYHLFGKSTRNADGIICSEMSNIDLKACGYITPWTEDDEPPSPADIERWLKDKEQIRS